ncbi:MAG: tetratricopeptide repeat protein [Planctomycetota bacterium]
MQVGPYVVQEELARGGMGVVYRARDPDGRDVALKVLVQPKHAGQRARLQREVQALARLRHPHVVSLLATGEQDGAPWLALELVEGETLEARLRRGPLTVEATVRLGQQLASALGQAHGLGILHRDLKPDNVLLRGDDALLTDFGLALEVEAGDTRLTATGIFLGTPGYWPPEQAQGRRADFGVWSDLYGLGAVLYACLTGQPPVVARSLPEYLESIRYRGIEGPRAQRPDVPRWLDRLCTRCLAVAPAARPASAEEVLGRLKVGGAEASRGSARWPGVAAAGGAVACALTVWAALSAGSRPRATTEPAPPPASDATPVAGDGRLAEAHAAYEDGRYVEALGAYDRVLVFDADDPEAWAGRARCLQRLAKMDEALPFFDRALELAPADARLYYERGMCRWNTRRYAEALEDAQRAVQLSPDDPTFLWGEGVALEAVGRADEALAVYRRVTTLRPEWAQGWGGLGGCLLAVGRVAEAQAACERGLHLDPSWLELYCVRGRIRAALGRHEEALEDLERVIGEVFDPEAIVVWAQSAQHLGRTEQVVELLERALRLEPKDGVVWITQGRLLLSLGRAREAAEALERGLELDPRSADGWGYQAHAQLELGRPKQGLAAAERALALKETASVLIHKATALAQMGRTDEARATLERATDLEPANGEPGASRALRANPRRPGRRPSASARGVELQGGSTAAWLLYGDTLLRLERGRRPWRPSTRRCSSALATPTSSPGAGGAWRCDRHAEAPGTSSGRSSSICPRPGPPQLEADVEHAKASLAR